MWNKANLDSRIYVNQWYKTKKLNKHVIKSKIEIEDVIYNIDQEQWKQQYPIWSIKLLRIVMVQNILSKVLF